MFLWPWSRVVSFVRLAVIQIFFHSMAQGQIKKKTAAPSHHKPSKTLPAKRNFNSQIHPLNSQENHSSRFEKESHSKEIVR
jgi:hypothetical protein